MLKLDTMLRDGALAIPYFNAQELSAAVVLADFNEAGVMGDGSAGSYKLHGFGGQLLVIAASNQGQ